MIEAWFLLYLDEDERPRQEASRETMRLRAPLDGNEAQRFLLTPLDSFDQSALMVNISALISTRHLEECFTSKLICNKAVKGMRKQFSPLVTFPGASQKLRLTLLHIGAEEQAFKESTYLCQKSYQGFAESRIDEKL